MRTPLLDQSPPSRGDGSRVAGDAEEKALRTIIDQVAAAYPWATRDHVAALLRSNYAATANARVQNYRLVLAERDTRARLRREAQDLCSPTLARSA
jgi:hypothetical protein